MLLGGCGGTGGALAKPVEPLAPLGGSGLVSPPSWLRGHGAVLLLQGHGLSLPRGQDAGLVLPARAGPFLSLVLAAPELALVLSPVPAAARGTVPGGPPGAQLRPTGTWTLGMSHHWCFFSVGVFFVPF